MTENVLDKENWRLEADAVIKDVGKHVKEIKILDDGTDQQIYFNLTTIEGNKFCVELSGSGFRLVGFQHNETSGGSQEYFETPYSLLNQVSPSFQKSFGNELINKLKDLENCNR